MVLILKSCLCTLYHICEKVVMAVMVVLYAVHGLNSVGVGCGIIMGGGIIHT